MRESSNTHPVVESYFGPHFKIYTCNITPRATLTRIGGEKEKKREEGREGEEKHLFNIMKQTGFCKGRRSETLSTTRGSSPCQFTSGKQSYDAILLVSADTRYKCINLVRTAKRNLVRVCEQSNSDGWTDRRIDEWTARWLAK